MPVVHIMVDCEAAGASPVFGTLTEFGAVEVESKATFHGRLWEGEPDPANPARPIPGARIATDLEVATAFAAWIAQVCGTARPVMVSDNPAYDFMWIAGMFDRVGMPNPFGHSARRISDFWAGLQRDWRLTQTWKKFRQTPHDHNPVNDAMGNVEAFERILSLIATPGGQNNA
jgi:hypothetical protein